MQKRAHPIQVRPLFFLPAQFEKGSADFKLGVDFYRKTHRVKHKHL